MTVAAVQSDVLDMRGEGKHEGGQKGEQAGVIGAHLVPRVLAEADTGSMFGLLVVSGTLGCSHDCALRLGAVLREG